MTPLRASLALHQTRQVNAKDLGLNILQPEANNDTRGTKETFLTEDTLAHPETKALAVASSSKTPQVSIETNAVKAIRIASTEEVRKINRTNSKTACRCNANPQKPP